MPTTRLTTPEHLDQPDLDPAELAGNLRDIARLNRLTGTTRAACRAVLDRARGLDQFTLLDVGTGAADFPAALRRAADRRGICVEPIAVDRHSGVLRFAARFHPTLAFVQCDGLCLPFAAQSIDVVFCAQMIHHLAAEQIGDLLREFARVCRLGFVILDLDRNWLAAPAISVLTYALSRNRLTRADGPQSARRAYRAAEIAEIAADTGLNLTMKSLFPFRWLGTWER